MCSGFSESLTEIRQLTMNFNTEAFDAAKLCECSISLANKCIASAGSSYTDRCPFGRDVSWHSTITDNSIISCGRGNIQQHIEGRIRGFFTSFEINSTDSGVIIYGATVIRHTVRQYGAYDNAHMAGKIILSGMRS